MLSQKAEPLTSIKGKFLLEALPARPVPLRTDEHGVVRIGKARIPLETVSRCFKDGETPEAIVQDFPALALDEVYATISHYLSHRDEVERYLGQVDEEEAQVRAKCEALWPHKEFRDRILSREGAQAR